MLIRQRISLAVLLSTALSSAWAQPTQEAEKQPDKLIIGALTALPRPEGFVVEDLRSEQAKATTPFRQTYKAPFSPFRQPVPLSKYERNIGDAELNVSPLELLAEKLIERYGERLKGKRLTVHEFSYALEQVINRPQGMVFIPLDPASVAIALIGTAAGTAMMMGKGIDLRLSVKLDAELDGRRIVATEPHMALGVEHAPARITRFAVEKFLYRYDEEATAPAAPAIPAKE